jgi:hypothetical protein
VRPAAALALVVCLIAAGCGGSSSDVKGEPAADSLEALWRAPGEDVAIVPGSEDFAPGRVRLSFLVVDGRGKVITRPSARIWLSHALQQAPFAETTARAETIGVTGSDPADASEIFVAHLDLPEPGKYWVLAEPVGGRKIQAIGNVLVHEKTRAPAVGDRAIASRTPTLRSAGGDLKALTTQSPPDREMLRYSIAESLAAHIPFVVTFATPAFCTSRTCGPVVDVVDAVRKRYEQRGIRFIHVEIFRDNDPTKGPNRWYEEWHLPSEPFTFVVGADGRIKDRFEGTVSVRELSEAVRRDLVR